MADYYLRGIPDDLKKKAEAICALKNKTMKDVLIRALKIFVDRNTGKLFRAGGGKKNGSKV